jgi:molybdate transport system substrate-binding protein
MNSRTIVTELRGVGLATALLFSTFASPAEIKILSTMAVRSVMEQLIPEFERASGHKVVIAYDTSNIMAKRVQDGEAVDLAILTPALIEDLAKQGKVVPGSNVMVARSGVGIAVRAGAPKPEIGTVDQLTRTLLDAKSIAYTSTGQSGTYFAGLIDRLGIGEQVRAKAKIPKGGSTGDLVARNEAEMAVQQIPELMATKGIELIGPLPAEVQYMTDFSAGVAAGARQPDAAQALIVFLTTPEAARVIKAKGMEPGKSEGP